MSAVALLVVALLQVAPVAPSIIDQAQRRDSVTPPDMMRPATTATPQGGASRAEPAAPTTSASASASHVRADRFNCGPGAASPRAKASSYCGSSRISSCTSSL